MKLLTFILLMTILFIILGVLIWGGTTNWKFGSKMYTCMQTNTMGTCVSHSNGTMSFDDCKRICQKSSIIIPTPTPPGAPGGPCPWKIDGTCSNGKCGHDGASDNYICCKPSADFPTGDYCIYGLGDAWCKTDMYEPCKHNCQCPIGVSCDSGKCGGPRPPPAPTHQTA